ncbi:MAG: 1-(5-phosphoribosyl)-5-[(5-phosphoribosylamino)methylideneamino] imidazole-4-carboxamide isomerase [Dokdonella sp.]|jgi:phosphoribosylformimino-5-aminoimidazole carboxamide ribotide isomerase|uniref:1-(5-phosphoribosyl)-5-[(5- phosphoribosylamino)methylideneamino]imidazole-4- carboxamide isomerase n=1 Tax=Dokdonella sp. TaxID=2291710 RepID=UPI001B49E4F8|nr:1-(5-phosphoribosyl)-5-[(5-phosphoribosylamino)methylideneamino] imidazole-4-carboxamide isomerase [Dokdonella sp.]MCC6441560.1 1-(5-phosphoribosyl)-5-[(5-phosphoribosylamino)methylideneamino] imidazole-4-carboxamide isomerase [Rhodanobacteraceae bacterium]MBK8124072.1 1-(5-phosphoribosyl)-5-[(5-phosphoribosylamino)methylideneamino] imidazole-4-carboxamide isomerase [Dokdonella sp.]MBP6326792.1 1-(5-phosphoribosyl)-5-[(5-phosphoribosylamino)methylideneamino] imidazole-4-carboxamide isomerase 
MSFTIYPAIDVRDGRVVRLAQGDYALETRYATDPFNLAMAHADAGAQWLHLVDLDAARTGGYALLPLLRAIAADGRLQVQSGGGVRSDDDVRRMFDAGAARVVVGSLAVKEPQRVNAWLRRFGAERIVIALDARRDEHGVWQLPVHGWTEGSGITLDAKFGHYARAGARHLLCTDIARDGMLQGPNIALYRLLVAGWPEFALQASGGVREAGDVVAARNAGCAGIVLGRALLEGRFALGDVLPGVASC